MKTIITALVWLVISASSVQGQSYKFIKNYNDDVYNIIPCEDSTFYCVAIHPGCGINSYNVRYINRHGNVTHSYESPLSIAHLDVFEGVTDDDNNLTLLYHSGGYNTVMQMDTAGNQIFCRTFNLNGYKFNRIVAISNSYYLSGNKIMGSPSDSGRAVIVKLDDIGNFQWARVYKMPGWKDLFFEDCMYRNDSLLVGGYYSNGQSPQPSYPYLAMIDAMGNLGNEFTYVIDSTMFGMIEPFKITNLDFYDDGIIFAKYRASAGVDRLMQLDGQMNPVWTKNIGGDLEMICASYDGTVFFNTSICFNSALVKMDPTGTVSGYSRNTISGTEGVSGTNMMYRWDCGYLLGTPVGWPSDLYSHISSDVHFCDGVDSSMTVNVYPSSVTRREVSAQSSSIVFSQVSAALTFTPTAIVINTFCEEAYNCGGPLSLSEQENLAPIKVYPNPSSGLLYFEASDNEQITVYDALGHLVLNGNPGNGTLDVSALVPGIYLLKIGKKTARFIRE